MIVKSRPGGQGSLLLGSGALTLLHSLHFPIAHKDFRSAAFCPKTTSRELSIPLSSPLSAHAPPLASSALPGCSHGLCCQSQGSYRADPAWLPRLLASHSSTNSIVGRTKIRNSPTACSFAVVTRRSCSSGLRHLWHSSAASGERCICAVAALPGGPVCHPRGDIILEIAVAL